MILSRTIVSINLVVMNGEKYIRYCLAGILAQTYPHELIQINILDNNSTDKTKEIVKKWKIESGDYGFYKFNFLELDKNLGVWPGQEELLKYTEGKYITALCVDVIIDNNFIKNAVEVMENDSKIGALEAKIYKYDLIGGEVKKTNFIDTCGFKIFRSRRIINIGHGEEDRGPSFATPSVKTSEVKNFNFHKQQEIFGVEGAVPFLRKEAVENIRVDGDFCDHDYFWYGDDLDFAWRMNLFGWKQIFSPSVIAWHDRQTTKKLRGNFSDFLAIRRSLPIRKRQLEYRNIRFTIIKNDHIINILKDMPYILKREVMMWAYLIIFEPRVIFQALSFVGLLPRMMARRKIIMKKSIRTPEEIHRFFA